MMTALVVVAHARPSAKVLITQDALDYTGSGVGLLPKGKHVPLIALLYGLLLPSGNDAAIALADHVAGTQTNFIKLMNQRAHAMGLTCTHYTTVSGIVDQGNHSCASDLALIAHTVLEQPVLAPIVGSRSAIVPFPIKGGKLFLYNNNPLLALQYPGADGVKSGLHRRRRRVPRGDRPARASVARRRPAALRKLVRPGRAAPECGLREARRGR